VKIGLRVLTRPMPERLPHIYRTLGENFNERVLPSIIHETLKAVVAQYNASQLITQREVRLNISSVYYLYFISKIERSYK
jgi:prohibitin 2